MQINYRSATMYQRRLLLLLFSFFVCFVLPCHSGDIITSTGPSGSGSLKYGETIVSAEKSFELGFFDPRPHPQGAKSSGGGYVGIWYYGREPRTIVWVANRDNPCSDSSAGSIGIKDGNLTVLSGNGDSCFSVGRLSKSNKRTAQLLDSGNLVLRDDESGGILWQSFDYPTDTFLPGMKMAPGGLKLISWKSSLDQPATGNYTFQQDEDTRQYIIYSAQSAAAAPAAYWKSGDPLASLVVETVSFLLSNFSTRNESKSDYLNDTALYKDTRLVMNSSGEIRFYIWDYNETTWYLMWNEPRGPCSLYNVCGNSSSCSINSDELLCRCLPGYVPVNPDDWKAGKYSGGCSRKPVTSYFENTTFLNLTSMKIEYPYPPSTSKTEEDCKDECFSKRDCLAYSFSMGALRNPKNDCRIWTTELTDLHDDYAYGIDLSVRVAVSDIESTSRSCKPCGINVIPYPLSSQPECGDPNYYMFSCDEPRGKLSFNASNSSYPVISINWENQSFVIEVDTGNSDSCDAKNPAVEVMKPFHAECSTIDSPRHNKNKIEIRWNLPPEPSCNTSIDCKDWPNSSCNVTEQGQRRCLCNKPDYGWDGSTINCTSSVFQAQGSSSKRKQPTAVSKSVAIYILAVLAFILSFSLGCIVYKRKLAGNRREIILGMPNIGLQEQDLITEDDKKKIDIPFFRLGTILVATDNFSEANKLGQGGFGPVYKGNFPGGQTIAVKRLVGNSGQGVDEFKNEVMLIAKLQHRNLVKLLGYCITTNEKILLYEYMPNKSLDFIIFDRELSVLLDWNRRFDIILGIARGLLYLHQDSRLRIIHRDLKVGNILLDEDMNPKISDFGLARIVEGKSIEANTNKVVGTFGYMSPEYALEGLFSIKSDVYSFGVVLLEIISGRKNTSVFFQSQEAPNLLRHTWKLWMEEKAVEMVDPVLLKSLSKSEILKCIHIGLLCVQEDPSDRPTMADVVIMLVTESMTLPKPNQPAFVTRKRISSISSSSSSSKPISHSKPNELTVTMLEGR